MNNFKKYFLMELAAHHDIEYNSSQPDVVIKRPKTSNTWFINNKPTVQYQKLQLMAQYENVFAKIISINENEAIIQRLDIIPDLWTIFRILQLCLDENETNDIDYISDWCADLLRAKPNQSILDNSEWVINTLQEQLDDNILSNWRIKRNKSFKPTVIKTTYMLIDFRKRITPVLQKMYDLSLFPDLHHENIGIDPNTNTIKAFDI